MGDNLPSVNLGTGRTATAVTAGGTHTCAVLDNSAVKCWGFNSTGELGQGDNVARGDSPGEMGDNLPAVSLGTGRTATAVTASATSHTCAILDDGTLKCWGYNNSGQLGPGASGTLVGDNPGEMGDNLPAANLGAGRTATAVTTGDRFTCVLLDNGAVRCWGANGAQLGGTGQSAPVNLGTGRTALAVTSGNSHTCALLDNTTVKCWGVNNGGQLGQGDTTPRGANGAGMGDDLAPIDFGTGLTPDMVTAGARHACVHLDDATLKCWGENFNGQLGLGDTNDRGNEPNEMGDNLPPVDLTGSPSMEVTLSADQSVVFTGESIDYHLDITNTGDTTLHDLTVEDTAVADCEGPVADITPAASTTIDCTYVATTDDEGTYSNSATVDSDETESVTSNQVDVTVALDRQPDLALKKVGGTRIGDDVYGADPTDPDQTVTVGRKRNGRVTFNARVQNDGGADARYSFRRIGGDPELSVRYFAGGSDVTAAVVNRTYRTPSIAPGQTSSLRVEVTVAPRASRQVPHLISLRAVSDADHPQLDTVRAIVLVF
jgi:hypothetical protein